MVKIFGNFVLRSMWIDFGYEIEFFGGIRELE